MGLLNYLVWASASSACSYMVQHRKSLAHINQEEVTYIEERCRDLNNPLQILNAKHSYLVAITRSGKKVRYDYSVNSPEPTATFYYCELWKSELFRKAKARPGLTIDQTTEIIKKHALKQEYSLTQHNCQHISRDAFNEITGEACLQLRNDFLRWLRRELPPSERKWFDQLDVETTIVHEFIEESLNELMEQQGLTRVEAAQLFLAQNPPDQVKERIHRFMNTDWSHSFGATPENIEILKDALIDRFSGLLIEVLLDPSKVLSQTD